MKLGIRWRGDSHTITMDSCPLCKQWVRIQFRNQQILGIKHRTFGADLACPYVQRANANPVNRFQKVVFDYADLEDRMFSAREAVRKQQNAESRMTGVDTGKSAGYDGPIVPEELF